MTTLKAFYWKYSSWAAVLSTVTLVIYLCAHNYENAWWLYIGNLLFAAVVLIGVFRGYHRVHDTASVRSSTMMGIKVTIYGVLLATLLCIIVLIINSVFTGLNDASNPPQSGRGDVLFTILSNTIGVNAILGALAAVIGATVVKKNQKSDAGKTLY
jgi:magnesium-transporting ATPase (P-type)